MNISDLNYQIRKKDVEFIEITSSSKTFEERLKAIKENLNKERQISEELREKIEILTNDYNKIKNSAINEPKIDKFCSSEDKTPTNFKNVNEEIKNLKHKIDGKIQKHLTNAKSPSTNNLDSHQEKIKNLNQINSNLTSFVLILQNRLKLYVLFINTTLKFIKFISKGKRST